jgi:hypothetical protein
MAFDVLANVVAPSVVAIVIAVRGFVIDEARVDEWIRAAGLPPTEWCRDRARRYLASTRRFRSAGALAGFVVAVALAAPAVSGVGGWSWRLRLGGWAFLLMLTGYLIGAAVAEVVVNRPRPGHGAALLTPRRVEQYLPRSVLRFQRGLMLATIVVALGYATFAHDLNGSLIPGELSVFGNLVEYLDSSLGLLGFALVGLLVWAGIDWLERMLVGRSQPASGADELAVDDAFRASSLRGVSTAGIGLLLNILVAEIMVFVAGLTPTYEFAIWVLGPIAFVLWVASIALWVDLSRPHGFRVGRGSIGGLSA